MRIDKLLASLQAAGLAAAQAPIYRRSLNETALGNNTISSNSSSNFTEPLNSSRAAPQTTTTSVTTDVTVTAPVSTNAAATTSPSSADASGSSQGCSDYYMAAENDSCASIATKSSMSLEDFMALNPTIQACDNLATGFAYCVSPVSLIIVNSTLGSSNISSSSASHSYALLNGSSVVLAPITSTVMESTYRTAALFPANASATHNQSAVNAFSASTSVRGSTVLASATSPSAVQALSPTVQTITHVATTTDYYTVSITETAFVRSTEYEITVTEYVTRYVTVSMSALAPLGVQNTLSRSACSAGATVTITLPASMSPTIIATPGESLSGTTYSTGSHRSKQSGTVSADSVSTTQSQQSGTAMVGTFSNSSASHSAAVAGSAGLNASSMPESTAVNSSRSSSFSQTFMLNSTLSSTMISSQSASNTLAGNSNSSQSITNTLTSTSTTTRFTTVTTTFTTNGAPTTMITLTPVRRVATSSSSVICNVTATSIIRNRRPHPTLFCNNWNAAKPHETSPFGKLTIKQVNNACGCILAQPKSTSSISRASTSIQSSSAKTSSPSSVCSTATPPAATQTGIASGCTEYYVAQSGDYCYLIADKYGLSSDTFMAWNPAVNAPSCSNVQVGAAYCVARGCASSAAGSTTLTSSAGTTTATSTSTKTSSTPATTTTRSSGSYQMYTGNGTVAAGWPSMDQWVDFETMFTLNKPNMQQSCANNWDVDNDSATEIAALKSAILSTATAQNVDPRFILAVIMQESNGCVRVITTSWGVRNPGLMQSHNGAGTCNEGGVVQSPCPDAQIVQMVRDGTAGTADGDGLKQCLVETGVSDVSRFYRAARIYNGGVAGYNEDDLGSGCCTLCYSSDVANRLTGWATGTSGCTL